MRYTTPSYITRMKLNFQWCSSHGNEAEGDTARFNALLQEYSKAPEVTRRRIYIETLQEVMPGIRSKIIVDETTHSILPLLNLDAQKGDQP